MNKREKAAFAVLGVLALSGGSYAVAAYQDNNVNNSQVIYACVTGVNGNITKVSNQPHACPKNTTPISWNMVGPKGDQGTQGLTGAKGDKGDQGIPGPKGDSAVAAGQTYLVSPEGIKYPFISSPYGMLVNLDGTYWLSEGTTIAPWSAYFFGGNFYMSTNCTGDAYTLYPKTDAPPSQNMAVSFSSWNQIHSGSSFDSYLTRPVGTEAVSNFRSYKSIYSDTCNPYESTFYEKSLDNFAHHLTLLEQALPIAMSTYPGRHIKIEWSVYDCTASIDVLSTDQSYWTNYAKFDSSGCKLPGDNNLDLFYLTYIEDGNPDGKPIQGWLQGGVYQDQNFDFTDGYGNVVDGLSRLDQVIQGLKSQKYANQWSALEYVTKVETPNVDFSNGWSQTIN